MSIALKMRMRHMNNSVGIIKEVDKLGRIVIPKEFRERFNLGKEVEIVVTSNGILIRNPEFVLVRKEPTDIK